MNQLNYHFDADDSQICYFYKPFNVIVKSNFNISKSQNVSHLLLCTKYALPLLVPIFARQKLPWEHPVYNNCNMNPHLWTEEKYTTTYIFILENYLKIPNYIGTTHYV